MEKSDRDSHIVKKIEDRLQLLKNSRDKDNPLMKDIIELQIEDYESILKD